jgi:hypothetical protein
VSDRRASVHSSADRSCSASKGVKWGPRVFKHIAPRQDKYRGPFTARGRSARRKPDIIPVKRGGTQIPCQFALSSELTARSSKSPIFQNRAFALSIMYVAKPRDVGLARSCQFMITLALHAKKANHSRAPRFRHSTRSL